MEVNLEPIGMAKRNGIADSGCWRYYYEVIIGS